ncbi:reverse transcriptase/maturase family protein [Thiothrix eikelboomii]|nr:reverse transcriptase/maturase family protein [Thiothrix eikelboomii]
MKRHRILLADLASRDNLALAVWKAARGKHHRPDVIRFTSGLDQQLEALASDILRERVPYADYRAFYIHDPKKRLIHAASFADRVLHHAIMNLAEPIFEKTLVASTYACRPDKGVHRAIAQVQNNLRRYPWYVQLDIAGYFPAIDHSILLKIIERRFKGQGFLALLWRIIDSFHAQPGKGLPIGSLTSQHCANFYLDGADRWLLETLKVAAHVRYMDDLVFWCRSKEEAKSALASLEQYLLVERQLRIKPNRLINRSNHGISYCGYRVKPEAILLSPRKRRRYQQLRLQWEQAWLEGFISEQDLQQAYQSIHAITLHADSIAWRKQNLLLYPPPIIPV